ncbi:MAG: ABC transporter permease [Chloroflexia bacterium]
MLARTRDAVTYRDLLRNLVVRDLKVRYRGSFIGFLWSLLNPLLMMGVYWFVFTQLLKSNKPDFHIFVFVALLPWNWCASAVLGGITSIVGNGHLIKKVYFPREILPLSVVISNGINFLFALPILFLLMALAGTGPGLQTMTGHGGPVESVAFSPDGGTMASASDDHTVRRWRVADGAALGAFTGPTAAVSSIAFSPDAGTLAAGSEDHTVSLWNAGNGTLLRSIDAGAKVDGVAFAPKGDMIAAATQNGTVRVWRSDGTPAYTISVHGGAVWGVAFSPDEAILAAGGDDRRVHLWQAASGAPIRTLEGHKQPVISLAFSHDGSTIGAGGTDGSVLLWRTVDGAPLLTLDTQTKSVYSLAFSPHDDLLVTGGDDRLVHLWRTADGTSVRTFSGHNAQVNSVAFSLDGTQIASGSSDAAVRLWATIGEQRLQFSPNIAWIPMLIVIQAIFLSGVAFFLSALNVFFRDTQAIMEVGIQAWFFLTPIIYDAKEVLPNLANVMYWLNPMASIISNYRIILYNDALDPAAGAPDPVFLLRTLITSVIVLVIGYSFFRRYSRNFGEEL